MTTTTKKIELPNLDRTIKKVGPSRAADNSSIEGPSGQPELWWIKIGRNWKAVKDIDWYGARAQFITMGYTQADPKTASQIRESNAKTVQHV